MEFHDHVAVKVRDFTNELKAQLCHIDVEKGDNRAYCIAATVAAEFVPAAIQLTKKEISYPKLEPLQKGVAKAIAEFILKLANGTRFEYVTPERINLGHQGAAQAAAKLLPEIINMKAKELGIDLGDDQGKATVGEGIWTGGGR